MCISISDRLNKLPLLCHGNKTHRHYSPHAPTTRHGIVCLVKYFEASHPGHAQKLRTN